MGCSITQQAGLDHLAVTRQIQGLARVPGAWLGNGLLLPEIQLKPGDLSQNAAQDPGKAFHKTLPHNFTVFTEVMPITNPASLYRS